MKKLDNIQGYRRSHKKIPTGMALADDQQELAAKHAATGKLGNLKDEAPKKSLQSYQNQMQPLGFGGGDLPMNPWIPRPVTGNLQKDYVPEHPDFGQAASSRTQQETVYDLPPGSPPYSTQRQNPDGSITVINHQPQMGVTDQMNQAADDAAQEAGAPIDPDMKAKLAAWKNLGGNKTAEEKKILEQSSTEGTKTDPDDPYDMRNQLQEIWGDQLDPEAAERRVIRQRAAQEAQVRATMGAGEAGRSGASALLEGEAGRLAEQKARTAELEKTMGVVGLGMELMGFDLDKNRYNKAEKRQAALAALLTAEFVDADSADEIYDMLNIPESARDPEGLRALQEYLDGNKGPGGDTGDEDTGTTTGTNSGKTNPNSNIAAPLAKNPDGTTPSTYVLPDGSFTSTAPKGQNKTTEELLKEQDDQQEHEDRGDDKTMGSENMDQEYFQEHTWIADDGSAIDNPFTEIDESAGTLVVHGGFIDLPVNAHATGEKKTFGDPPVEHVKYKYYDVKAGRDIIFWYYPGN